MNWHAFVFHPLTRSLGTLLLVALLGLVLSAIRRHVEDRAMVAIEEAEAAAYEGEQMLWMETTAGPVTQVRTVSEDVLPAVYRECAQRPKKVRVAPLDI